MGKAAERSGGAQEAGPPWVFGLRGAPREAPENTKASLRRALGLGLDGLSIDVRRAGGSELVLCADATLDRTSDGHGLLADHAPRELAALDAGAWFSPRFAGEKLLFLEEALALRGRGEASAYLLVLREPETLPQLARQLAERARKLSVRVLSDHRRACLEARDLGLSPLYYARTLGEDVRRWAAEERIAAVGARWREWESPLGRAEWPCERFAVDIDDPEQLLAACRRPIHALVTTEPRRALAIRELVRLAPSDRGAYPLQVDELGVDPGHALGGEGEWCGRWRPEVRVRNPFDCAVSVELSCEIRRGAFECRELPERFELAPGETRAFTFSLVGGSWSPGGDPLLFARFRAAGADARELVTLDAPLRRVRHVQALEVPLRLVLLRESPGDPPASVTVRRRRNELLVALESAGDLAQPKLVVYLDGEFHLGVKGLRLVLPPGFSERPEGLPFSVGIEGLRATRRGPRTVVRRWAGGLPDTLAGGDAGRLLLARV
jgi:glycerophosphoryl diester phosphodiesterase